ncbi:nuclear protein MDM1 isoform X3 [Tachysurus fulvidraco]|uniref:nuclear protein MDM1 isoform X3 n=1 Tax=Tachysurus fulvidraco TaxID=1234273 RepID=UPI001FEEBFFA|nr:nuclear protein MDM1 isoform X3 [Tachysurus fulvidraco]
MTVHFKGISRHRSKHKARRVRDASPQRAMRLAGLPSDQLGICKEPQLQSKKRALLNPPQVSSSLQLGAPDALIRRQITTRLASPPAVALQSVISVAQAGSVENVETPLSPRPFKPTRTAETTPVQEECSPGHLSKVSDDQEAQKQPADAVNHVLRRKAGLKSERQRNCYQSSEYQRQFQWKNPAAESPLLTAQEMLYSSNRSIPPFKSNPVVMETEYKRSFKGSPPPRGPRLRRDMELNEDPPPKMENIHPEQNKRKKKRHRRLIRKSIPKEKTSEPQALEQKPETPQDQKAASPKVVRCVKLKTEYSSNFRSPLQYCCRDGAWVRTVGEEVRELREKAEAYRKRAWGTHFSRQHLSQILSEQNCLWEASSGSSPSTFTDDDIHSTRSPVIEALDLASVGERCSPSSSLSLPASRKGPCKEVELPDSPTLHGQRRKAWDEEVNPCERGVAEIKQRKKEKPEDIDREGNINVHSEDNEEEDIGPETKQLPDAEESGNSSDEGRVPTPKLKSMAASQRTHHDRTTPATGGAILVSPPKIKYTKTYRSSEPPLGKVYSPYRQPSCVSVPDSKNEGVSTCRSPLAAGMATVDPLPLREDTWIENSPERLLDPKPPRKSTRKKASSAWLIDDTPSHGNRIQGTMRNPEFLHNGNIGVHRPDGNIFLSSDCLSDNDLDDRMSQISFQSAASCSMASQVLDRAQKRKEDFWGKSQHHLGAHTTAEITAAYSQPYNNV